MGRPSRWSTVWSASHEKSPCNEQGLADMGTTPDEVASMFAAMAAAMLAEAYGIKA
jgi:hypothetical protein